MKNIFIDPYIQTAEQRLLNQLTNRVTHRDKSDNIKLDPEQKRTLNTLDPHDKLYFLRNLPYSTLE